MKSKIVAMLIAVSMLFCCIGCSTTSETQPGSTGSAAATDAAGAQQAPAAESTEGGASDQTLVVGANEIVALDPHTGSAAVFTQCIPQCYEALVDLDLDGNLIPKLAESWEYSEDGLEYTFHLRGDVTFHDGSVMQASDVVYSINRLLAMGQGFSYFVSGYIDSVEAVDASTVKITLNKAYGPFIMCMLRVYIVSEAIVKANYDASSTTYGENCDYGETWLSYNDAGTGPYVLSELNPQEKASFVAYADYWRGWTGGEPAGVNFILVTEAATVRSMMSNNQLDVTDTWQSTESLTALDKIDGVDLAKQNEGSILYLQMNTKCAPLDDVHVRKALAYLVDYDTLLATISNSSPCTGLVSSSVPGYTDQVTQYEFNIEKAKEELSLSAYADQLDTLSVDLYWIDVVPDEQKVGLTVQAAAQQAGLTINLVQTSWLSFTDSVASVDTTPALSLSFNAPDYPEAGSILMSRFHSSTCGTWSQTEWLQDEKVDTMLDEAMVTMDTDARYELYAGVQQYLSEIVPSVGVYSSISTVAYNANHFNWLCVDRTNEGLANTLIPGDSLRAYDYFTVND